MPDHAVSRQLAARAVATIGGNPFYLQLLGEQLAGLAPPLDEGALKEALSRLVFHRTGRLAMFFEAELARVVGRSAPALAILDSSHAHHVARARRRLTPPISRRMALPALPPAVLTIFSCTGMSQPAGNARLTTNHARSETVERSNRVSRPGAPRRIAWRTIAVVSAVTSALGGCSLAMQGPDPNWDGKQKPDCAESYVPVMIDAITAGGLASMAVQVATDEKVTVPAELTIATLAVSLLYTASAASGARTYNECRTATAIWRAREAIRERDRGAAAGGGATPASPAPAGAAAQLRVAIGSPTYFCVRSPSRADLEICMRERSRCEHARDIMGLPRDEDCAPHDAAWCFGASGAERCLATRSACEAQLTRARGGASECSERR